MEDVDCGVIRGPFMYLEMCVYTICTNHYTSKD